MSRLSGKIHVLKTPQREGLIRARVFGARQAEGQVSSVTCCSFSEMGVHVAGCHRGSSLRSDVPREGDLNEEQLVESHNHINHSEKIVLEGL